MPQSKRSFINRMALVFDFDLTLAPGTIDAVLSRFGLDYPTWEQNDLQPLIDDGWDEIEAKGQLLRQLSATGEQAITSDFLKDVGRNLEAYPGVEDLLRHLRIYGHDLSGGAEVELHILSSGFTDIITATPVAALFDGIWGSSLFYDREGRIDGVKRAVISIEKARYLTAIAKKVGVGGANEPAGVDQDVPEHQWHVPLDQMLYVGDGASDIPAFDLVARHGGVALGIVHGRKPEDWSVAESMHARARVDNLGPPDFDEGSPLHRMLTLAVEILAKRVALRRIEIS